MIDLIGAYLKDLIAKINNIEASGKNGEKLDTNAGIDNACRIIKDSSKAGKKIILIGNGGSAAIAGHMAIDFWKNGGMKAISFNDSSLLTCISNDYGYQHVFEKPIEMFAEEGDVLIAISSSGRSENIIRAVKAGRSKKNNVITLSGFDPENPLRKLGDVNYFVPSAEYGPVEVIHQLICHWILDVIMKEKEMKVKGEKR